jgi:hypothetical protein
MVGKGQKAGSGVTSQQHPPARIHDLAGTKFNVDRQIGPSTDQLAHHDGIGMRGNGVGTGAIDVGPTGNLPDLHPFHL